MTHKTDCFAYTTKNRRPICWALSEIRCKDCRFYKERSKVKNNPFYAWSYDNKKKHKFEKNIRKINDDLIMWK